MNKVNTVLQVDLFKQEDYTLNYAVKNEIDAATGVMAEQEIQVTE